MNARSSYTRALFILWAATCVVSPAVLAKDSRKVKLPYSAIVNGKEIPAGAYRISWNRRYADAIIAFTEGRNVTATVEGRWVERDVRYHRDIVVYHPNCDGSRTIDEIRLGGLQRALVFSSSSAQNSSEKSQHSVSLSQSGSSVVPGSASHKRPAVEIQFLGKPRVARRQADSYNELWLREVLGTGQPRVPVRR